MERENHAPIFFSDEWPSLSEGAANTSGEDPLSPQSGECQFITKTNGNPLANSGGDFPALETNEVIHPVCFVQVTDSSATYWRSQGPTENRVGLEKKIAFTKMTRIAALFAQLRVAIARLFHELRQTKVGHKPLSIQTLEILLLAFITFSFLKLIAKLLQERLLIVAFA